MFARFNAKPSLATGLPIFCENLQPGSVYEIAGKSATGKTALLYEVLCKCLLPISCNGLNVGAVFIDNDRRFSLHRLIELLKRKIQQKYRPNAENQADSDSNVENFVTESLQRFLYLTSDDSNDFKQVLSGVEKSLWKNRRMASILFVDTISAFILFDQFNRETGTLDREKLYNVHQSYVNKLKKMAADLNLVVIVTQLMFTVSDENDERSRKNEEVSFGLMSKCWSNFVSYRIQLKTSQKPNVFTASKIKANGKICETLCQFEISKNGLTFL